MKSLSASYNAYLNLIVTTETRMKGLGNRILSDDLTNDSLKKEVTALKLSLSKTKNVAQKSFLEIIKIAFTAVHI